jgi:hypothetical protein
MNTSHLTGDLLVRAIDSELTGDEIIEVENHLNQCENCRLEAQRLRGVSANLRLLVDSMNVANVAGDRDILAGEMLAAEQRRAAKQAPERVMKRFGWGMAVAATLALGIILAPKHKPIANATAPTGVTLTSAIEVDGESFIPLPFSNPDLPVAAPRVIQMQVSVSTLAELGVSLEPVANEVTGQDTVLADVLLGADGQPMGVHVLSPE